jgi:outer membrane protein assembly factor BamB
LPAAAAGSLSRVGSGRAVCLAGFAAVVLAAAGCGGGGGPSRSTGQTATTTTVAAPPALRAVSVTIVDGDTGRLVPAAVASAAGARRRGRVLLVPLGLRSLTVSARAPAYGAQSERVVLGRALRQTVTLELYRSADQWTMYGASPARTQDQEAIQLRPPFRVVWARDLGSLLEYPAAVDDGVAYLSNWSGRLFALSMSDGRTLWRLNMHTAAEASSPAVVGDELIVHVKTGRVLVLDRANGRIVWSWPTSGEIESSPVVEDGVDYLGDWAGDVYALDLHHHRMRWVYHDGCKITASVTIHGGALYLGDYCGRVIALDRSTGRLLWSGSAASPVYGTSATAGGRLFVPSRDAGAVYAFTTSGRYLWHVSTGGLVYTAPAVWRGRVYFGSYSGLLYCVSAATGAVLWTLDAGGEISGSPTVVDGVVYAGTFSHRIVGADALTGRQLFSFPHGEYVAVSGNEARLLLYGWASLWAVEPRS